MMKVFERLIDLSEKQLGVRRFLELLLFVGALGLAVAIARTAISGAEVLAVLICVVLGIWYLWAAYIRHRRRAISLSFLALAAAMTAAVPIGVRYVLLAPAREVRALLQSAAAAKKDYRLLEAAASLTDALALAKSIHEKKLEAECTCALGEVRLGLGLLKEASSTLKACISVAAERSLALLEARGLLALSRVEMRAGNFEVASLYSEQAREKGAGSQDKSLTAQAERQLGLIQATTGDPEAARSAYRAACASLAALADFQGLAHCKLSIASLEQTSGALPAALEAATQSVDLFRTNKDLSDEADALLVLGQIELSIAGARQAQEHLESARSRYRQLEDHLSEALVETALARLERDTDPDSARNRLSSAIAELEKEGAQPGFAEALLVRAELERGLLNYDQAQKDYRTVTLLAKQMHLRDTQAWATLGLGDLNRLRSENDAARQYFIDARALFAQSQNAAGQGHAVRGLGNLDWLEDREESARKQYDEALALFERAGHVRGAAGLYLARADLARSQKDAFSAERDYQAARRMFKRLEGRMGQANATLGLAHVEIGRERYEQALAYLVEAQGLFKTANNALGEGNALCVRGDVERRLGHLLRAREFFKLSREIFERHREPLGLANLDLLEGLALAQAGARDDAGRLLTAAARAYEALDMQKEATDAREKLTLLMKSPPAELPRPQGGGGSLLSQ